MKTKFLPLIFVILLGLTCVGVHASKRMGSGKPVGQQSNNVSQREAAKPAQPGTQPSASPSTAPTPAQAPVASPTRRPWAAMAGGLAAGLGLAWLAHSMGLGAEFGQFLMFGLLAFILIAVVGYFMRRRNNSRPNDLAPMAFQGAGSSLSSSTNVNAHNQSSHLFTGHQSQPVNNQVAPGSNQSLHSNYSSVLNPTNWSIPEGFDVNGFLETVKKGFISMQDAWDRSDTALMRTWMTDDMLSEIKVQLSDRDSTPLFAQIAKTEVNELEAVLLGIEQAGDNYLASVEFKGMIKEGLHADPEPFKEVWNMSYSKSGNKVWLIAGIQQVS